MDPFSLVFTLFGLLVGLATVAVLGDFSRALELKRSAKAIHIGWLAPLLGLFVVLELTGFWVAGYQLRGRLSADPLTLYAVLAIFGSYYFAATLIFPSDPEKWPDFDAWYERQKRMIIGAMLTAYLLGIAAQITLDIIRPVAEPEPISDAALAIGATSTLGIFGLLVALLFVKSRPANRAMLAALVGLVLLSAYARSAL